LETNFPANLLTGAKHAALLTDHLADTSHRHTSHKFLHTSKGALHQRRSSYNQVQIWT